MKNRLPESSTPQKHLLALIFCIILNAAKIMVKTVSQKMGIREGARTHFINLPEGALDCMKHPDLDVAKTLNGTFDYIHLFVIEQAEQAKIFLKLKEHLNPDGMLWVSWPKGGQLGTDLSLPKVIKTGYTYGLVESTCLSVNEVWSAIKFTHPKKGKTYNNSHAKLQSRTTSR